jgi:hypothetical protein
MKYANNTLVVAEEGSNAFGLIAREKYCYARPQAFNYYTQKA